MAAVDGAKWAPLIAADLNLPLAGVNAVIELLLAGNTVPFIARYRKEKPVPWMKFRLRQFKSVTPMSLRWRTAVRRSSSRSRVRESSPKNSKPNLEGEYQVSTRRLVFAV